MKNEMAQVNFMFKFPEFIRVLQIILKGFSEVDLLKIWKGLFYCMWMSDKPLIQVHLYSFLL